MAANRIAGIVRSGALHCRCGSRRGSVPYNRPVAVTVLLFAAMAERAGVRSMRVDHEFGDTVAAIRDRVVGSRPELAAFTPTLLYAIDEEYVRESDSVSDGATVAFIPPVSGG